MIGEEKFLRLPKWAQKEIRTLERRVEDAERRAKDAELATNPDETDTFIEPNWQNPIGLPKGVRVNYRIKDDEHRLGHVEVTLKTDHKGERYLSIHSACGGLLVEPQVTNVIRVKVADR